MDKDKKLEILDKIITELSIIGNESIFICHIYKNITKDSDYKLVDFLELNTLIRHLSTSSNGVYKGVWLFIDYYKEFLFPWSEDYDNFRREIRLLIMEELKFDISNNTFTIDKYNTQFIQYLVNKLQ